MGLKVISNNKLKSFLLFKWNNHKPAMYSMLESTFSTLLSGKGLYSF